MTNAQSEQRVRIAYMYTRNLSDEISSKNKFQVNFTTETSRVFVVCGATDELGS